MTEKPLSMDDFDTEIDPLTGKTKLTLKKEFAHKLGIPDQAEDMIEAYVDENGEQKLRLKDGVSRLKIGKIIFKNSNQNFKIYFLVKIR